MHKRNSLIIIGVLFLFTAVTVISIYFVFLDKDGTPSDYENQSSQEYDGVSKIEDIDTASIEEINSNNEDNAPRFVRLLSAAQQRIFVEDYTGALAYYKEAESLEDIPDSEKAGLYWSLSAVYGELNQEDQRIMYADKAGALENVQ